MNRDKNLHDGALNQSKLESSVAVQRSATVGGAALGRFSGLGVFFSSVGFGNWW